MKLLIERLNTVTSTQDRAREMAEAGAPEGTVVVARVQERGRGRLGRRWLSPSGGLWFSIILRPAISPARTTGLTLLAAVSVTEAVHQTTGITAGIKWPNDVLVNGKKLGGILTEMLVEMNTVRHVILGVGLNVNVDTSHFPIDLLMPVTSLMEETGREIDLDEMLRHCLDCLARDYGLFPDSFNDVLSRWKELSVVIGRRVTVSQPGQVIAGIAVDVDNSGALLVTDDDGQTHLVHAGDLSLS